MVDPKAKLMLARLADPNRSWYRHKETGRIRDAVGESIAGYDAMCKKRPGSTITWEKLTREQAEKALIDSFKQTAQSIVDQAKAAPMEAPPAPAAGETAEPAVESLDS